MVQPAARPAARPARRLLAASPRGARLSLVRQEERRHLSVRSGFGENENIEM